MVSAGIADKFLVQEARTDDTELRRLITQDSKFLGAVVWVIGHLGPQTTHHTVNERGMVLGEHVRFVEPVISSDGRFRIYDPQTGKASWASDAGAGRDLFSYRVVEVFLR
jgi:hypothetical protein